MTGGTSGLRRGTVRAGEHFIIASNQKKKKKSTNYGDNCYDVPETKTPQTIATTQGSSPTL